MIFTDDDWQEVKVGRIFKGSDCRASKVKNRGNQIDKSDYVASMGHYSIFTSHFEKTLCPYECIAKKMVFITDGATWIKNWLKENYPMCPQILDFYHVCEHISKFAKTVLPKEYLKWYNLQRKTILEGRADLVIKRLKKLKITHSKGQELRDKLINYLKGNLYRMNYPDYLEQGWFIGSGAIEASHKTVVQKRMKLSGQRWSDSGAIHLLNLRVCYMSDKWDIIINKIKRKKVA